MGARFLRDALGWDHAAAARHAGTARLLDPNGGDLPAVGQAYAAGDITRGHVEVAAGVHRRLSPRVRDTLIPVIDEVTGEEVERRCIVVVDAVLARQARGLDVPQARAAADRLIQHLDPPSPQGTHRRRHLHLTRLPDGSLQGRFACGPTQALAFHAVIAAGAAPHPGHAIDPDGIEHPLPDDRTPTQRRIDALTDALTTTTTTTTTSGAGNGSAAGAAGGGANGPAAGTAAGADDPDHAGRADRGDRADRADQGDGAERAERGAQPGSSAGLWDTNDDPDTDPDTDPDDQDGLDADDADTEDGLGESGDDAAGGDAGLDSPQEPTREGQAQIRRPPGIRSGPYPPAEIIITATLDQLAAALTLTRHDTRHGTESAGAPGLWPHPGPPGPTGPPGPAGSDHEAAGQGDALHAVEGFAHAQHAGPVHPRTLALLACTARLRTILLDRHGAVLHLGRAHRLATPTQKRALLARDIGCVIPGCPAPGEHCDVHHVIPWAHGGATDLPNLVLLCPRHHAEIDTDTGWHLQMIHGVPWARPPTWAHHHPPLLRNTTHHPHTDSPP